MPETVVVITPRHQRDAVPNEQILIAGEQGKGCRLYVGHETIGWSELTKKQMRELRDALDASLGA